MKVLIAKVVAIEGNCPVYEIGDKIVIEDGFRLNLEETDAVCMHSLASLMPYYVALSKGGFSRPVGACRRRGQSLRAMLRPCQIHRRRDGDV